MNPCSSAPGHWQRSFAASSAHSSGATAILAMGNSQVVTKKKPTFWGLQLAFSNPASQPPPPPSAHNRYNSKNDN